jgi:hypothetical protein
MMKKYIILLALTFIFQSKAVLANAPQYQLIDLGLLENTNSYATSINNLGQITGTFECNKKRYVFVWDRLLKYNYKRLTTTADPRINDDSEVFGSCLYRQTFHDYEYNVEGLYNWKNPFSYWVSLNFYQLSFPESQWKWPNEDINNKRSVLWDVNNLRQILLMDKGMVSFERPSFAQSPYKIWINHNGSYTRILNSTLTAAWKINNHSEILGCYLPPDYKKSEKVCVVIYDFINNENRILNFSSWAIGNDIDDLGRVAGIYYDPISESRKGFFDDPKNGRITIDNFSPTALNNLGQIIGNFLNDDDVSNPAYWNGEELFDLKEMTSLCDDQGHQWDSLDILVDINDAASIIGLGTYRGAKHGFLLVPAQ